MLKLPHTSITTVGLLFLAACSQPPAETGPSYADLVVTYNAELEALDRLEAKREQLIEDYEAESILAEPTENAGSLSVEGLLKSAKELKDEAGLDLSADPNELIDKLTERTGGAEQIAGQLIEGLLAENLNESEKEPTPEELAAAEERKTKFDAELKTLDVEISAQQKRVERARQARDTAEAEN